MADISMCTDKNCKLRKKCHRFTAKATPHWQTYFTDSPKNEDGTCDYFWDNKEWVESYGKDYGKK